MDGPTEDNIHFTVGRMSRYRWPDRWLVIVATVASLMLTHALAVAQDDDAVDDPAQPQSLFRVKDVPKLSLHGFADLTATAEWNDPDVGGRTSSNAFALGEFDLFLTSQLTSSISFLGETVIELEDSGDSVIDVERVFIKFSVSDSLYFSAGRRHLPLGYWHESYHHGLLLQPTIERPTPLRFEDDGGVLPTHVVGLQSGGRLFAGPWAFDYSVTLSNGRAETREKIQGTSDANDHKALGLKLSASRSPSGLLAVGPMVYFDRIPPDPATLGREGEIEERILGLHFAYRWASLLLMAEYFDIRHDDEIAAQRYEHEGYYALALWDRPRWKPYLGFDRLDLEAGDPYYSDVPSAEERYLAGIRYEMSPFTAFKFEYRREEEDGSTANVFAAQIAYGF